MDTKAQRKKALRLSVIGSIGLVVLVYLVSWGILELLQVISRATDNGEQEEIYLDSLSDDGVTFNGFSLEYQERTTTTPYQLHIGSYVLMPTSSDSADVVTEFNDEIQSFLGNQIKEFEADLIDITGSINSAESELSIKAVDVTNQGSAVEIEYEIETYFVGDTGVTSYTKSLIIK